VNRWTAPAALAESAVRRRHLRRLLALPGTRLGVVGAPATPGERLFTHWHYWWQAQLIDCLVDAQLRAPDDRRRSMIRATARGIRWRNGLRWRNNYYDDMAWLALALDRAERLAGIRVGKAVPTLTREITTAWESAGGEGIPWRRRDVFHNVPANGPAAILLARTGNRDAARHIADWVERRLALSATGLVADGWRAPDTGRGDGSDGVVEETIYTYGQGVAMGAELELALTGDASGVPRIHRLVDAVGTNLAANGVLAGHGGGNGGLFTGILARHLAGVATLLPGSDAAAALTRRRAADLVLASAEAAWAGRLPTPAGPVFSPEWVRPARRPGGRPGRVIGNAEVEQSTVPERDLSVQLAGWMLLEAAAALPNG